MTEISDSIFAGKAKHFELLDLSENMISKIGENSFKDVKIGFVQLNSNRIEKIPTSAFTQNSVLGIIVLTNNPIDCNCDLAQIVIYTKNQTGGDVIGTCASPSDLNGTSIEPLLKSKTNEETRVTLCDACELNNTCLNDGECVTMNKTTKYCQCNDGFTGDYCENVVKSEEDNTVVIVVVVIIVLVVLAILVAVIIIKRRSAATVNREGQGKDQPDAVERTKLV